MLQPGDSSTTDFETLIGSLDYPMFIVTTAAGDDVAGCLVGFVTQTSIDPPLILVCLSRKNRTCQVAESAVSLAVHVLHDGDEGLASLFGETTSWEDQSKLARSPFSSGPDAVPIIDDLDYFTGRIVQRFDAMGDHVGHLIDVRGGATRTFSRAARIDEPQLGFQQLRTLEAGKPA